MLQLFILRTLLETKLAVMETVSTILFSDSIPLLELSDPRKTKGSKYVSESTEYAAERCSANSNKDLFAPIRFWRFHGGWRTGVAIGMTGASIILLLNIGLLIWIHVFLKPDNSGLAIAFEGSCDRTKTISTWCHLAINIISTLLLGANNIGMQCLSAPTRAEVDAAHAQGTWLSIGVPNALNLGSSGPVRVTLWLVLGLSSIPLHLL